MNKRMGLIALVVAGVLAVGSCYGFLSVKTNKTSSGGGQEGGGSGVAFPEMMGQLSQNMTLWARMNLTEKKRAIEAVIGLFKNRDNIAILKSPEFYVGRIDETLQADPAASNLGIMGLIRILAIMDYDLYNGQNKDELAKKTLGERGFAANEARRQASSKFGAQPR